MSQADKRRNWSYDEDIMLLIQVANDKPFAAEKGQVAKAWQTQAETLMESEQFTRVVDARKLLNRFTILVDEHRRFAVASAKLSGSDQEEQGKHMLLDDIVCLLDDIKATATTDKSNATADKSNAAADKDKIEQDGLIIRELAMQTMKRRSDKAPDGESSKKKPPVESRRTSLASAIEIESERERATREKELEFQRFKFESDLKHQQHGHEHL
ncbi:hypothetical protein H257_08669 [Aphanomyces astaci]|uniref:Uncharacterized protein n=1 Tax=Aphanomyces astaci TaxID=112090 RepID=W4GDU4_APHAT|nr:hypothetical protein H257_08669 [Aphanomyces astaci]ETV77845.1 hypothetical protein H257_08669 [Aphanomyces astaci]|eukprot:XP_009832955.1 hypothetical protein H257_08669 [Aphanomyces astaci]